MRKTMNFDLGYVLLSFLKDDGWGYPQWRRLFRYGNKNLAQVVFDGCERRDIGVFAITSALLGMPMGQHDRFEVLREESLDLPSQYQSRDLGENSFVIERRNNRVYFVRSQLVCADLEGKRTDFITVGVPYIDCTNLPPFVETAKQYSNQGVILTKPGGSCGLPLVSTKEHAHLFDGIIAAAEDGRKQNLEVANETTRLKSEKARLNVIGVSGCHLPKGIGLGYTQIDVDASSETRLLDSLKSRFKAMIPTSHYIKNPGILYQLSWQAPMGLGIYLPGLFKK